MQQYKIIAKGKIEKSRSALPVSLVNYVIVEENGARYLMLKCANDSGETVVGMRVRVTQTDNGREKLSEKEFAFGGLHGKGTEFVLEEKIPLLPTCEGCEAELIFVDLGRYQYTQEGDSHRVDYADKAERDPKKIKGLKASLHGKRSTVERKKLKAYGGVGVFAFILLAAASVGTYFQLDYFKKHEVNFKIGDIEYEFADENLTGDDADIVVTGYAGNSKKIKIPDTIENHRVIAIEEGAFRQNKKLRTVTFEGEIDIGKNAFYGCKNLTSVNFEKVKSVGDNAFASSGVKKVNSVLLTDIGDGAFASCTKLTSVLLGAEEQTIELGGYAFRGCTNLESVRLEGFTDYEGSNIFDGCEDLEELYLYNFNYDENYEASNNFLYTDTIVSRLGEMDNLRALEIGTLGNMPSSFAKDVATESFTVQTLAYECDTLPAHAFANCRRLTEINLPEDTVITRLNTYSLAGTAFESYDFSPLQFIGAYAFSGSKLKEVNVQTEDPACTIGKGLFMDCAQLESVTLSNPTTRILSETFKGCISLVNVTYAEGVNPVTIEESAFEGCVSLPSVSFPASVGTIGKNAFANCSGLQSLLIPATVQSVGERAFAGCDLRDLQLREGISVLGEEAFADSGVGSVTLPYSLQIIGRGVFKGCDQLAVMTLNHVGDKNSDNEYLGYLFGANTVEETASYVPAALASIRLTEGSVLPDDAFYGCANLRAVTLPTTMTEIGDRAFYGCKSLFAATENTETDGEEYEAYKQVFHDYLQIIGDEAFHNCSSLTELTLPDGLSRVGEKAFSGCIGLTEMTLPFTGNSKNSVNSSFAYVFSGNDAVSLPARLKKVTLTGNNNVYASAFQDCSSLEEIYVAGNATAVGNYAFYGCSGLKAYSLPDSLRSIGSYAFYGCVGLEEIEIPVGVTSIGGYAFGGCDNLTTLEVPFVGGGSSSGYGNIGYFFNGSSDNAVGLPQALTEVVVTGGNAVKASAFANCENLRSVRLEGGISSVGNYAFANSVKLRSVTLPEGLSSVGNYAFEGCYRLRGLELPSTLSSLGYGAFDNCYNLYEIGNASGVSLSAYPFINVYASVDEKMPTVEVDGLTLSLYGEGTGAETWYLTAYDEGVDGTVSLPRYFDYEGEYQTSYVIPSYLFAEETSIKGVQIPNGVQEMGAGVFQNCYNLVSAEFSNNGSLTKIGDGLFVGCSALTTVKFGTGYEIEEIGEYFFDGCYGLQTVTFGARTRVGTLGSYAFNGCYGLQSFSMGEQSVIERIGYYAFSGCNSLTTVDFGENGSVGTIDEHAFADCYNLTTVDFGENGSCGSIGAYAFYNCYALSEITMPSGVESVGEYAFAYCSQISSIRPFDGLQTIGQYAFVNCSKMREIRLPYTLQSIGNYAFEGCEELYLVINDTSFTVSKQEDFTVNGGAGHYALAISSENEWTNILRVNGVYYIRDIQGDDIWYVIDGDDDLRAPSLENVSYANVSAEKIYVIAKAFQETEIVGLTLGSQVRWIEPNSFYGCSSLKTVNMGNSRLTEIPEMAFAYNGNLQTVTLPSGVQSVGDSAFSCCYALRAISLPTSLRTIGNESFYNCSALSTLTFNEGLEEIGNNAFYTCNSLTQIQFPSSLNTIGNGAFQACENLQATLPDGLVTVGAYAFAYCNGLQTDMPQSLRNVGEYAFYNVSSLTALTLPEGMTTVGEYAFACTGLKTVVLPTTLRSIGSGAFFDCTDLWEIYNLSPLSLTVGSSSNGNVASNAYVVYSSLTEEKRLVEVGEFLFVQAERFGDWALRRYTNDRSESLCALPSSFTVEGRTVEEYGLWNNFVNDYYTRKVIIPTSISFLQSGAFGFYAYRVTLYYEGGESEWKGLSGATELSGYNALYYFTDCIHADNQWKYDGGKQIQTGVSYYENRITTETCTTEGLMGIYCNVCKTQLEGNYAPYVISATGHYTENRTTTEPTCTAIGYGEVYCVTCKEILHKYEISTVEHTFVDNVVLQPTCTTQGKAERSCSVCNGEVSEYDLEKIAHSLNADGKCTVCNAEGTAINQDNYSSCGLFVNDGVSPFGFDSSGWYSTNRQDNGSATLTFTADRDMEVRFTVKVSSEENYDKLLLKRNGDAYAEFSGKQTQDFVLRLTAGETLSFTYSKDGSNAIGEDCGKIQEFVIVYDEAETGDETTTN